MKVLQSDLNRHIKPVLLLLFVTVLLMPFGPQPGLAGETPRVDIAGKQVALYIPDGFCLMDKKNPVDLLFLQAVQGVFKRSHKLLAAFADCGEQKAWRSGRRPYLDSFGQYITPLSGMNQNIGVSRPIMAAAVCKQMERMSGTLKKQISKDVKKRMEKQVEGAKFTDMKLLKGNHSDENACYFSSRQNIRTPTGSSKTIAGVSAITLIGGKIVQINLYDRYKNDETFASLFRDQRHNITSLLAVAGNK